MREHLGVDVDAIYEEDLMTAGPQKPHFDQQVWDPDQEEKDMSDVTHVKPKKSVSGVGTTVVEGIILPEYRLLHVFADLSSLRSCWRSGRHRPY